MILADRIDVNGVSYAIQRGVIAASSSGDNTLLAGVTGFKIRVVSFHFLAAGDVTVRWESGAGGTAMSGQMAVPANGGIAMQLNPGGYYETAASALLNLELSGAVSVAGGFNYILVP